MRFYDLKHLSDSIAQAKGGSGYAACIRMRHAENSKLAEGVYRVGQAGEQERFLATLKSARVSNATAKMWRSKRVRFRTHSTVQNRVQASG